MTTIYKYPLPILDEIKIQIPFGYKIKHLGKDPDGNVCIWVEVRTNESPVEVTFWCYGTGHEHRDEIQDHIGTVVCGAFVWHVYKKLHDNIYPKL